MFNINILLPILLLSAFSKNAQDYKNADLPDAMTFLDGTKVKTEADWEKRKKEIKLRLPKHQLINYVVFHV
ncbi:MAG: hypothetical protein EA359_16700 [Balneolaceae bacterium]|nr:MAG: hypothetical protein EA359_16700 [Balneolaceae bacterium]